MDKFERVCEEYTKLFYYAPYYMTLARLLEQYLGEASEILEVGGADGIVALAWNRVRQESHNKSPLTYRMVEPVKRMVEIAQSHCNDLNFRFMPFVGTLDQAVASAQLDDIAIDGLVISKTLHEVFIQHDLDHDRLFNDLHRIINAKNPQVVVLGILNRVITLSPEETERFIAQQVKKIGHGHDPAKEYVDQQLLDMFMEDSGYQIVNRKKILQPLAGFDPSPWGETITVYRQHSNIPG